MSTSALLESAWADCVTGQVGDSSVFRLSGSKQEHVRVDSAVAGPSDASTVLETES